MAERNHLGHLLNERIQKHDDGTVEYWRDIPGFDGAYRISDLGRVKSMARTFLKRSRWNKVMITKIREHYRKQQVTKKGYSIVGLVNPTTRKWWPFYVGRLVLEAFVGPCPEGMECCHSPNPNGQDNRLVNVRWDTHSNNQLDMIQHGTVASGERNGSAVLTEKKVTRIRALHATRRWSIKRLSVEFGVSTVTIRKIVKRLCWKHIP